MELILCDGLTRTLVNNLASKPRVLGELFLILLLLIQYEVPL